MPGETGSCFPLSSTTERYYIITAEDRIFAIIWWIVALGVGPMCIVGFFVGGWVILAALWAIGADLDTLNPFKRSNPRPLEQARPSSSASPQETEEFPNLPEPGPLRTTHGRALDSDSPEREGKSRLESEQPTEPLPDLPLDASDTAGEADLHR